MAQRYYLAALRAAHVSGDRAIGANILGFMSIQAARSPKPADAVVLAESALKAERELTPAVAASLHGRLALGAARAGDEQTWRRAQDRAFELLARSVPAEEPPWIYWFTEADASGMADQSLIALGRPAEAEPYLRRTLSLIDPAFVRDRAGWLCHLATARIAMGAVEQACATANEAATLIRRLDSPHDRSRLKEFRSVAAPYARSTAVREFNAKHRDLVGTSLA
jgi:hypothetical protein